MIGAVTGPAATLWRIFGAFAGCDRPAYRHPRGDLSFAALHDAVLRLLPALARLPDDGRAPVLIWGHKDVRYPVAYWACLLAGRALVPIEPETPPARIQQIAATCGAAAALVADPDPQAAHALAAAATALGFAVLPVPHPDEPGAKAGLSGWAVPEISAPAIRDDDTAYIMFSSGTLGQPKGIGVSYANLADFIAWLELLFPEPASLVAVTGVIRHCFDVSLFELWLSWTRLLPLIALDHADLPDSTRYIERLAEGGASVWVSTPSIARLMLQNRRFGAAVLPRLAIFLFCGERLPKALAARLFAQFPGCRVINTYGPTECTVAVTSVDITPAQLVADEELPIGTPRPGTWLELSAETPPGEAGEIVIHGASVGPGYLGLAEKQARAFPQPGVYRTGDRGARGADGHWYFHGRADREVKIQGVRIDLNDVETHLRRLPGIEDAVVQPYLLAGEPRALQAFLVGPSDAAALARFAAVLAEDLPPYLVPRYWYADFPARLNANSKLDPTQLGAAVQAARLRHVHAPASHPPGIHSPASAAGPQPQLVGPALQE